MYSTPILAAAGVAQESSNAPIIAICVLVVFLLGTVAWLFSRYKMCPSDKILIVYGKVGAGRSAKCLHGGATFVMPIIQNYAYMDLNPLNIDVPLKGALSSQNIRVDVPSSFIVGISTQPEIMQNAASRLLGRTRQDIRDLASEIIMGQMRVVIAALTIEEINADREKLIRGITGGVDVELHKVGLYLINANITDIRDASGYIAALGQEAAARAINDAMIKVADETRRGEIGKAEALREQTVQVAMANAAAVEGSNEAEMKIADSTAKLKVRQAEAHRVAEVAEREQAARAEQAGYIANRDAELQRAELERATQTANEIVAAEILKRKQEIAAEAAAAVLVKEQQGKADALIIAKEAEGRAAIKLAQGEADALLLKKKAEGEGLELVGRGQAAAIQAQLEAKARGFREIVAAAGDARAASGLLVTEQLPTIVETQASAVRNLSFDKVVVMGGGNGGKGGSVGGFVQDLVTGTLPLHELASSVGVQLPDYLGKSAPASAAPEAPAAPRAAQAATVPAASAAPAGDAS
ncbi:MAG TPA: flotillin family protein [Candidatus Akkermansia intestinavium]|nr:flotillin family protein [Candidatus Akkermansia intestinavium]